MKSEYTDETENKPASRVVAMWENPAEMRLEVRLDNGLDVFVHRWEIEGEKAPPSHEIYSKNGKTDRRRLGPCEAMEYYLGLRL